MKLRYHPGISNWPPTWVSVSQEKTVLGELGIILTNVSLSHVNPTTTCHLTSHLEGKPYIGALLCKDSQLCRKAYDLLQQNIGKSISEIGDLDLPYR